MKPTTNPDDAPEEPFALARPTEKPPAPPAIRFANGATRQRMLLCGLDCLSGQLDLFQTDGGPKRED